MTGTASPTDAFFAELARRRHEPRLAKADGSVRFDLDRDMGTDHWLVTVRKGDVTVSRRNTKADAVVRTDRTTFDRFVTGEANPTAATLRGLVSIDGSPELVVLLQRALYHPEDYQRDPSVQRDQSGQRDPSGQPRPRRSGRRP